MIRTCTTCARRFDVFWREQRVRDECSACPKREQKAEWTEIHAGLYVDTQDQEVYTKSRGCGKGRHVVKWTPEDSHNS